MVWAVVVPITALLFHYLTNFNPVFVLNLPDSVSSITQTGWSIISLICMQFLNNNHCIALKVDGFEVLFEISS